MPEKLEIIQERFPDPESWVTPALFRDTHELSRRYMAAGPSRHLVLDKFFEPEIAEGLDGAIRALADDDYPVSYKSLAQRKLQLGSVATRVPHVFPLYETLMRPAFVHALEEISGFASLAADRQFTGAGLHRYVRGGFAEIHLDATRHPLDATLHHRLNLLIFLNREWRPGWGGELVFWSSRNGWPHAPARIIEPLFNRAVVFPVSNTGWHSVARVKCPKNQSRNSIAIHYFNSLRQPGDDSQPHSVIWHSSHGWRRQLLFGLYNRAMRIAKPYAPHLRRLRADKFDGAHTPGNK